MTDYKSMYYHLAGRMAATIEVMEATSEILASTTNSLVGVQSSIADLTKKLKLAQIATEELFVNGDENDNYTE